MTNIKIHPAAECVRVMDDEELASLAASIEANGQRDPIILGRVDGAATEKLVDGRNRLRACEIAGVEPRFETVDFEDDEAVKAFVADKSEHRNLTKTQQAMRLALLYPDAQRGRGKKDAARKGAETSSFSFRRVQQCREVLGYSHELALAVRDGTAKLDEALERVKAERRELESAESKLERLRTEAPDLADLVTEDRMKLTEAHAALEQRKTEAAEREQNKRETLLRLSEDAYRGLVAWSVEQFVTEVRERLPHADFRKALIERLRLNDDDVQGLPQGASNLLSVLKGVSQ